MYKNFYLYFDMDGVLVNYHPDTPTLMYNKGFFLSRPCNEKAKDLLHYCLESLGKERVFILSHSISSQCTEEKKEWIATYLPFFPKENVFIIPKQVNKGDFVAQDGQFNCQYLLIDDYGENCREWESQGRNFKSIRYYNELTLGNFLAEDSLNLKYTDELMDNYSKILSRTIYPVDTEFTASFLNYVVGDMCEEVDKERVYKTLEIVHSYLTYFPPKTKEYVYDYLNQKVEQRLLKEDSQKNKDKIERVKEFLSTKYRPFAINLGLTFSVCEYLDLLYCIFVSIVGDTDTGHLELEQLTERLQGILRYETKVQTVNILESFEDDKYKKTLELLKK